VRYRQPIIAATGIIHAHPDQNHRAQRSGKSAAPKPNISAARAAVAVQPYQYIAGRKLPIDGATVSREWCVPQSTTPIVG